MRMEQPCTPFPYQKLHPNGGRTLRVSQCATLPSNQTKYFNEAYVFYVQYHYYMYKIDHYQMHAITWATFRTTNADV